MLLLLIYHSVRKYNNRLFINISNKKFLTFADSAVILLHRSSWNTK